MIKRMSSFAVFSKSILPVLLMFLFSCKKDVTQTDHKPQPIDLSPTVIIGPGDSNCYAYHPLIPQPDGTLTGYVDGVPITISSYIYQAYDNNGNPITYMDGDPFWGQIGISPANTTAAAVIYNSADPQDDQFVIRFYHVTGYIVDIRGYEAAFSQFVTAIGNGTLGTYLFNNSIPDVSDYATQMSSSDYHDVTGRLIRINPQQVQSGTDASGNPIFVTTTFAWAPTCYPRNGIRPGTNSASIAMNNKFLSPPNNLSVAFIKDGVEYRRLSFPNTRNTTSSPINIPSGTYTVRVYKQDLDFQTFTIAGNYWEIQAGQNCANGVDIGTATLSAGASYTMIGNSIGL